MSGLTLRADVRFLAADVALEDEVDLRAGRAAIKEGAAVEPSPFQLPENLLAHHRLP
jgi:hypothetical protein